MDTLKAKSNLWCEAIASELGLESCHDSTAFELMYEFFESADWFDEKQYKRIKNQYGLENTISDDEYRHHISGVLLKTFKLCKEVYKQIPDRMEKKFQYLSQDKCWNKYIGYLKNHNEKAIVNVVRMMNASIIEVVVQTSEIEGELLYWNSGQVFIMNFVSDLGKDIDEPLTIAEA